MEKYAKLLAVFRRVGRVHSRIKAQKLVYILKSLGYPISEKFEYRNYGPYSEELASELRSSVNAAFLLEEKTEKEEVWSDETVPYERYDYSVTPHGEEFLETYLRRDPQLGPAVDQMATVAEDLNEYSPRQLELIATIMFLEDQPVRDELIVPMIESLKPQFTRKEIEEARGVVNHLRSSQSARAETTSSSQ